LLALKASVSEPIPLAFKAIEMSDAPLVLHYFGTISRINRKLGDNQSFISLYAQCIHFWKKRRLILYIPALCLGDVSPNKPEMKGGKNHQWDVHVAHPDIDRWWISISAFHQEKPPALARGNG